MVLHSAENMPRGSSIMPGTQRESFPNHRSKEIPQIAPRAFQSEFSNSEEHLEQRQTRRSMHDQVHSVANPYSERADQIGPSHQIPGIWHLDGLLTPPGWKVGDEPLDPQSAMSLYQAAREEARIFYMTNSEETEHLSPEEQKKRNADRDLQWNLRNQLDQILYAERVNVYKDFEKRQGLGFQPEYEHQQELSQPIALEPPQPINAPFSTTYAVNVNKPFPPQPIPFREPRGVNASNSTQNQPGKGLESFEGCKQLKTSQIGDRSFPTLSSDIISPALIDPILLPQTLESIYRYYQERKIQIQRLYEENERSFASYMAQYGPHLSPKKLSPGIPPPSTNQPTRPFYSSSNGNTFSVSGDQRRISVPRPPQYESPTRAFDGPSNSLYYQTESVSVGPSQPGNYQSGTPEMLIPLEQGTNQAHDKDRQVMVQRNGQNNRHKANNAVVEAKGRKENVPPPTRKAGFQSYFFPEWKLTTE